MYAGSMRARAAICLTASVAAGTALCALPAQATFPGTSGRLAFSSQGDIWTVTPAGTGLLQLTATADEDEAQAVFSPDGTRIAYRRRPTAGEAYQVYVMNADGSDQRRVSTSADNQTQPAWSPDGRMLVFRRSPRGNSDGDVWAMNLDGSNPHALVTTPGADERYPVFSPDASRLAFTSSRDGQYEVYAASADGAAPLRLTTHAGYDSAPSWSPDSGRLAFERGAELDDDPTKDIWVMRADGTNPVQLTSTAGVDEGPAFSPDATQIAFTSGRDGNYEIYRMGADGSGQTRVLALPTMEESPDWQALGGPAGPGPGAGPGTAAPVPPGGTTGPSKRVTAAPDQDADGLTARRERTLGTSDLDRDSDDDGLSDTREAPRGGTYPSRRDSDRDGLSDGVEQGVRRPVADPPGRVRGTSRARFRADADPRTRTNAAHRDTDRDGRADGREDANHNGRVDRGERDPRRRRA